jgi:hypothetical protein
MKIENLNVVFSGDDKVQSAKFSQQGAATFGIDNVSLICGVRRPAYNIAIVKRALNCY